MDRQSSGVQVKDIFSSEQHSANSLVVAHAPLASLLGYATAIRSMTSGEGSFSMEFLDFSAPLDDHVTQELFSKSKRLEEIRDGTRMARDIQ